MTSNSINYMKEGFKIRFEHQKVVRGASGTNCFDESKFPMLRLPVLHSTFIRVQQRETLTDATQIALIYYNAELVREIKRLGKVACGITRVPTNKTNLSEAVARGRKAMHARNQLLEKSS